MATKDYKDPRWQEKRLRIMDRDAFTCRSCGSKSDTLHVHHRAYEKGGRIWDTPDYDLVTLCEKCHDRVEEMIKDLRKIGDAIVFMEYIGTCPFNVISAIREIVEMSAKNESWGVVTFGILRALIVEMKNKVIWFEEDPG